MFNESIITEVTVTGLSVYGLALLFVKALMILLLAQTLSDQFEFSPASIRHTIWLIVLSSLAALPVLTVILPAWHLLTIDVPAPLDNVSEVLTQISASTVAIPSTLSVVDWMVSIYLLLLICRLLYLSVQIIKVGIVTSNACNAEQVWYQQARRYFKGRLKIKVSAALNGPVTWGTLYPVILLPGNCDQWSPLEKEMVLRHELGHIQRADWLAQLLGQLVAVLYWPVPGMAKALRSLSLEAEQACDDAVLADGVTPADYAALLLRQAKVNTLPASVALGKPSELAQRIRHIVNAYVDRAGERKARLCLSLAAGIFIFPFAAIHAVGSFPAGGVLAGMHLTPVVLAPRSAPVAQQPVHAIGRPVKPGRVVAPPKVPVFDRAHQDALSITDELAFQVESTSLQTAPLSEIKTNSVKVLFKQQPKYPAVALRRGLEGRVVVEFDLDTRGMVINPRVSSATSSGVFNRAVLSAISHYRYEPYSLNGEAIVLTGLREEFRFQLTKEKSAKGVSTGDSRAGKKHSFNSS